MNTETAREAILNARCCVVYFTKRDGTLRRMVCHVPPEDDRRALSYRAHLLTVWDVEKGDVRTVNLSTVQSVRPVKTSTPRPLPPQPEVSQTARIYSMSEISALFDNRAA